MSVRLPGPRLLYAAFLASLLLCIPVAFAAKPDNVINYTIKGDAQGQFRDTDTVICSRTKEAFMLHSPGEWVLSFETQGPEAGERTAKFTVAAPSNRKDLQDGDMRTDDRFRGSGMVNWKVVGKGDFGMQVVEGKFEAGNLKSEAGFQIQLMGNFRCPMM